MQQKSFLLSGLVLLLVGGVFVGGVEAKPTSKGVRKKTARKPKPVSLARLMCPGGVTKSSHSESPVWGCPAQRVTNPINPYSFPGTVHIIAANKKEGNQFFGNIYDFVTPDKAQQNPDFIVGNLKLPETPMESTLNPYRRSLFLDETAITLPAVQIFDTQSLEALNSLWSCRRSGTERAINKDLYAVLAAVYNRFGKPIHLLSGFRNQEWTSSHHYKGNAADITMPGVSQRDLATFLKTMDSGRMGIGLYKSGKGWFIHVDTGRPESYYWVDRSLAKIKRNQPPGKASRLRAQAPNA